MVRCLPMHLGSLLVVHGLERGVAAAGRGLAGGDVECLGPKLSQLERFDGGCADYDPDAVGAALRRRRAGAAVLYRGDACRTKGWVKHDFAGQIAANHRAELWEPCLLYTSPSPRDKRQSRMPSSA